MNWCYSTFPSRSLKSGIYTGNSDRRTSVTRNIAGFKIAGSIVGGAPAQNTLLIDFGEIAPGSTRIGRWNLEEPSVPAPQAIGPPRQGLG
jgi:hypothetical protein